MKQKYGWLRKSGRRKLGVIFSVGVGVFLGMAQVSAVAAQLPVNIGLGQKELVQVENPPSKIGVRQLGELLNGDGMLNLESGYRGNIDPARFHLMSSEEEAQHFVELDSVSGDERWQLEIGTPGMSSTVRTLITDSIGNLYAGGAFTTAGSVVVNRVAKWNGVSWSTLGNGMNGSVNALARDSTGKLYAGGAFSQSGATTVNNISVWNGSSWEALGSGVGCCVYAIAIDSLGNLYVGGSFTQAGGATANYVAMWNGSSWSSLGSGMNEYVYALAVDSTDLLYAGGFFTYAGGANASHIAKWNGSKWSTVGSSTGLFEFVFGLTVDDADKLYVGGGYVDMWDEYGKVFRLDGSKWSTLARTNTIVTAVEIGSAGNIFAGGPFKRFTHTGGGEANHIAMWDGSGWSTLGSGTNSAVTALVSDNARNLYVGGKFTEAGGNPASRIAKWKELACGLRAGTPDALLRDTVAEWLGKCVHGLFHNPPVAVGLFSDVSVNDHNSDWIEQIYHDGITKGCNESNTLYCPKDPMTKTQAVKLILRAKYGGAHVPPPWVGGSPYPDVPPSHPDLDWIAQAETEGVTAGCGDGSHFCPGEVLTGKGFLKMLDGAF